MLRPHCSVLSRLVGLTLLLAFGGREAGMALPARPAPACYQDELYHWAHLPVRVFIDAETPQEQPWARIAAAGFDEWGNATGGAVGCQLVGTAAQAQVTVHFAPTRMVPGHPGLVGLTTTFWVGPVLQRAEIILATGDKTPGDLQTAAAHELGHALGIRGHSHDPDDLMYFAPLHAHPLCAQGADVRWTHPITQSDLTILKLCYPAVLIAPPVPNTPPQAVRLTAATHG